MPARILIVEDDTANREGLLRLLTQAGYDTISASTFEEGRQLLAAGDPDLLITDLRLDGFNGLQLIITRDHPIPSIVITGFADRSLENEARHLGADYLVKPFAPDTLLSLIAKKLDARPAFEVERRWARKPVAKGLVARVDASRAKVVVVDVSYGGLRLEVDSDPMAALPPSFDVTLPTKAVAVHVDLVWQRRTYEGHWLCGAALSTLSSTDPAAAAAWHGLVDAF